MRAVALADPRVIDALNEDFVVGWKNIYREDYVGYSNGYRPGDEAVGTTNGAGGHNVQMLFVAPDGAVLHALAGFWHPDDLLRELRFAKLVAALWDDDTRTREEKVEMLALLHRTELRAQSEEMRARSDWQGFDRTFEIGALRTDPDRDTVARDAHGAVCTDANGIPELLPLNELQHRRAMQQPFRHFNQFDVAAFSDYGRYFYDLNNGGKQLRGQDRLRARRQHEQQVAAREREREAEREAARRPRRPSGD